MTYKRKFLPIFLESLAKDCYSRVVDKLITEVASTVERRGGTQSLVRYYQAGAKR